MKIVKWIPAAALVLAVLSGCSILFTANTPPVVTLGASPIWIVTGEISFLTAVASDPQGDPLTYEWYEGDWFGNYSSLPISGETGSTLDYWKAVESRTEVRVKVVVSDSHGLSAIDSVDLTVDPRSDGSVLVVNTSGTAVTYYADRLNGTLSYSINRLGGYLIPAGTSYLIYGYATDWWDFKAGNGSGGTWETVYDDPGGIYLDPGRVYQFILLP